VLRGGHVTQHALRVERPAMVGADHAVMAGHVRDPAHVQRRAAVRADVCAAAPRSQRRLPPGAPHREALCRHAEQRGMRPSPHAFQAGGAPEQSNTQTLTGGTRGHKKKQRTRTVQAVHGAVAAAEEHQLLAEHLHAHGFGAHLFRDACAHSRTP